MQNKSFCLIPNEKQKRFFLARERYIAYGGARGGGKSWAVRAKALLLSLEYPGIRLLIIRRTLPELEENHIRPLRALIGEAAEYRDKDKSFRFPKGDTGETGRDGTNGTDGDDGTTFTPAVSAAGVISWTNDGGKSNPPSVDIVAAVLAALPTWTGGNY